MALDKVKLRKNLPNSLKKNGLDTFLLVRTGCKTCEISYEDSLKKPDTLTIFLVYEKDRKITLMTFSDKGATSKLDNLETDIFSFITSKKQILKQQPITTKNRNLQSFKPLA
ncbi:MAG: hypothetical protein EAY75_03090 [Bacteroidetes bacterium]|nr:MAG: hypothetical protein EAY75_03090 [Bacteroidota bacterium]